MSSNHQQVIGNQSLLLQKVSGEHRGSYSCTATNTEGQGESNQVFLRVQCKWKSMSFYNNSMVIY